jgi:hypothetical protein
LEIANQKSQIKNLVGGVEVTAQNCSAALEWTIPGAAGIRNRPHQP